MARPKKDGRFINCYMNSDVLDKLEKYFKVPKELENKLHE